MLRKWNFYFNELSSFIPAITAYRNKITRVPLRMCPKCLNFEFKKEKNVTFKLLNLTSRNEKFKNNLEASRITYLKYTWLMKTNNIKELVIKSKNRIMFSKYSSTFHLKRSPP